jgi:uncharacterized membrane-anchored protein YitT (DUF2179 family)
VIMRIVTTEESNEEITRFLQLEHFGVTSLDAKGARGNVKMILTLVNRTDVSRITDHLQTTNPHAFFSIEDVRYANEGVFRPKKSNALTGFFRSFTRPGKKK